MKEIIPPAYAVRSSSGITWLDDNGIMIAIADSHDIHTLEDAIENTNLQAQLINGEKRPFVIDMTKVKSMSREARAYYAGTEPPKILTAVAIVTKSNLGKLVANFFISLTKPVLPTRMFTDMEAAKEWLIQYKIK